MHIEEIQKYRERIEGAPDDLSAYEALERLYTRAQDWSALVELYRRKAPHLAELGEKRLLWQKIARVAEEVLDEPELAIQSAHEILPPKALDRATLRAIEAWAKLFSRYERLLNEEKDVATRVDLLRRRAVLVEERRGPEAAFPEFAKAFLEAGRHDEVRGDLERIGEKAGLWRDLLAV